VKCNQANPALPGASGFFGHTASGLGGSTASCEELRKAIAAGRIAYDAECGDGAYCTATRTSSCPGTCQPKIAPGGTCRENTTCTPGMQCFPSLPCAAGLVWGIGPA
jgi:hypothetical protein